MGGEKKKDCWVVRGRLLCYRDAAQNLPLNAIRLEKVIITAERDTYFKIEGLCVCVCVCVCVLLFICFSFIYKFYYYMYFL